VILLVSDGAATVVILWLEKGQKTRKNCAGSEIPLPTLIKEKEPLWYRVPYNSSTDIKEKGSMRIRRVAGLT
jgi:hypothetical protein